MKLALLAGTQSGCGKTTITLALLQYLKKHKTRITSFKAGPDFLDPMWHQKITQGVCYNLDTRMIGLQQSTQLINQQQQQTDVVLIEGVMGLFDGRTGVGQDGSSADLAKGLNCPVILVINAKGISGSIVPLVSGFYEYANKMDVKISGIIVNHVGSQHHADLLDKFLFDYKMPPLLAWMEKQAPVLPERHLGLTMPEENQIPNLLPFFHVNNDLLLKAFRAWEAVDSDSQKKPKLLVGKTIAIVKDKASCFIYPANIDWIKSQGAEIHYFSILESDVVPKDADAIWLPGGYPELYAQQLSESTSWESLKQFIKKGKPVLAECGGSMMLGETLTDIEGRKWSMAGILPYSCTMQKKLASLGYREDETGMKGHEFHYSVRQCTMDLSPSFNCSRGDKGIHYKNVRSSYIHWYFASAPEVMADWLG